VLRLAPFVHAPPSARRQRWQVIAGALALAAVVALAFFVDLGRPAFWDPGESRYAETVREMLVTGNWLDLTLGFLRYYDKPPGTSHWPVPSRRLYQRVVGSGAIRARRRPHHRMARRLRLAAVGASRSGRVVLRRRFSSSCRPRGQDGHAATFLTTATLLQAFAPREIAGATCSLPCNMALYVFTIIGLLVKGPVAVILPLGIVVTFLLATRTLPG
jgi:hypothetical protein